MNQLRLSSSQEQLLTALVNEYQGTGSPVKAERIAATLERDPGTIRNNMQDLKSLHLVTGVPGPAGGYKPEEAAFDVLDRTDVDEPATMTLSQEFERVTVTVERISFPNVLDANSCTAQIRFQQSVSLEVGNLIAVGPTPKTKLVVAGEVDLINEISDTVRIDVRVLEAPVTED